MDKTRLALKNYADTAADLAENVKRNIAHNGVIDNKTVLALNRFIIATHSVSDLTSQITSDINETDEDLN
jgi:hypothetical protein